MNSILQYIANIPFLSWILLALNLILFVVSVIIDRTRFRNCIFLFLLLLSIWYFLDSIYGGTITGQIIDISFLAFWSFWILIVPVLLIINGFIVLYREGLHFSNALPLLFGIAIILGIFSLYYCSFAPVSSSYYMIMAYGFFMLYACIIFLGFLFYSFFRSWIPRRTTFDFIIVLGAGLINGEKVTPLLASRCDKAMKVYNRSYSASKIICSGGQGSDEKISEAQAMKNYLVSKGVPASDILLEDESVNTIENLKNSRIKIMEYGGRQKIAVVTSNFHVFRAVSDARSIHMYCTGIGAPTAFYYWPTAMIREFAALMKRYLAWFLSGTILVILPFLIMAVDWAIHQGW